MLIRHVGVLGQNQRKPRAKKGYGRNSGDRIRAMPDVMDVIGHKRYEFVINDDICY